MNDDDKLRLSVYEKLRHKATIELWAAENPIEKRIFEIEYQRYDDLIRMIKETA